MTVTAAQIAAAEARGLTNVEALAAACDRHDLRFYLGCVILAKETGGKNIYGHDRGGVFATKDGSNIAVTEDNFAEFLRRINAGATSNGVGPMQITYRGHFPIMAKLGLKPWVPADNIEYGISLIAKDYRTSRNAGRSVDASFQRAATEYNLGRWLSSWLYGRDAVKRAAQWKTWVGTEDLGTPAPPAAPAGPANTSAPGPRLDTAGRTIKSSAYGDRVWWGEVDGRGGGWVAVQDALILDQVQLAVADSWGLIRLSQGGLSASEPKSAKTHVGLAAWDVAIDGRSQSLVWELCKAFLRAGHVAFPRGYGDGMTPRHIHVVSRETISQGHREAQDQLNAKTYGYLHQVLGKRGAGLAGAKWRRYIGPSTELERWAGSPYNPVNAAPAAGPYFVTVAAGSSLIGNSIDRVQRETHERGDRIVGTKIISRWGRKNLVTPNGIFYSTDYLSTEPPAAAA